MVGSPIGDGFGGFLDDGFGAELLDGYPTGGIAPFVSRLRILSRDKKAPYAGRRARSARPLPYAPPPPPSNAVHPAPVNARRLRLYSEFFDRQHDAGRNARRRAHDYPGGAGL